jgi:hypothetical protein
MNMVAQREQFFRHLLQACGPLMVWALHFFGAYVLVATGCCTAFAATQWLGISALRVVLWLLSALAIVVIAILIARSLRLPNSLRRSAGTGGSLLALLGVAWTTLPMFWALPLCLCQPPGAG